VGGENLKKRFHLVGKSKKKKGLGTVKAGTGDFCGKQKEHILKCREKKD